MTAPPPGVRLVLVTGPSGAGRTTAIRALEDCGFEAIDNLPLALVPRLLAGEGARPLALGIDPRGRDFSAGRLMELREDLRGRTGMSADLLYLDCEAAVLMSRYGETRRRHPVDPGGDPARGIAAERSLLAALADAADTLIDTTAMTPHDLRAEIARLYGEGGAGLVVNVLSFSYRRGIPRQADAVHDARFLANPHWIAHLRGGTGLDAAVRAHVRADPRHDAFFARVMNLLDLVLPAHAEEGRSFYALAFGCTGGRHRSVTLAEGAGAALAQRGWRVSVRHRELERIRAANGAPAEAEAERTCGTAIEART